MEASAILSHVNENTKGKSERGENGKGGEELRACRFQHDATLAVFSYLTIADYR